MAEAATVAGEARWLSLPNLAGTRVEALRVCRAVLGPVDADDAWSETFLSALKAYPDLPDGANVEAWLVTIAHRKAIDVRRAAARRATPVDAVPERHDVDLFGAPVNRIGRELGRFGLEEFLEVKSLQFKE